MTGESASFVISGIQTSINSECSWFLEFNSKEAVRVSASMKYDNCFTVLII